MHAGPDSEEVRNYEINKSYYILPFIIFAAARPKEKKRIRSRR